MTKESRGMRQTYALIVGGLLVMGMGLAAFSQVPNLCDYRTPETDLSSLFLTFFYNYFNAPETPIADVSSGRFAFTFSRVLDSPDLGISIGSTNEFTLSRLELTRAIGDAFATARYYLDSDAPLFVFGETQATYASAQAVPGLELRLGGGYGRLTDVTPLAKAIRIGQVLLDDQAIDEALPEEILLQAAALIGQESEYRSVGDAVAAIAPVIEEASGVPLSARSLLSIAEEIVRTGDERQCGWAVQAGFGYEVTRRFGETRNLLLTLSSNLARPLDLGAQLVARFDISGPLRLASANASSISMAYTRQLTPATLLVAEYAAQRFKKFDQPATSSETIKIQLVFELGKLDLSANLSLTRGTPLRAWAESLVVSARVDLI